MHLDNKVLNCSLEQNFFFTNSLIVEFNNPVTNSLVLLLFWVITNKPLSMAIRFISKEHDESTCKEQKE